ncbi:MAG: MMPL family transporter [Phycisphaerales bacterium]
MHELPRDRLLLAWAHVITTRPVVTLTVCVVIAALSTWLAATRLGFHPERSDLVAADLDWNARYAAYKRVFPRWNDLVIAMQGAVDPLLAQRIADALNSLDDVARADAGFIPLDYPLMFRLERDPEKFRAALDALQQLRSVAQAGNANDGLAALLAATAATGADSTNSETLARLIAPFLNAARGIAPKRIIIPGLVDPAAWQPLTTASGGTSLIFVEVRNADTSASGIESSLASIRATIADVVAQSPDAAGIEWGVTGIAALEADETAQSIRDSTVSSILALVLIALLLVITFRGWRMPFAAVLSLLLGVAWSFGWATLAVGHLQLLSVVFTVILLGLGVDFALHLATRLNVDHDAETSLQAALPRTFRAVGPGLITGAITTAAAFMAITFTDFSGAAEMGLIAGGGILLCLIAVMSAFPAILSIIGPPRSQPSRIVVNEARNVSPNRRRNAWLTIALMLVVGSIFAILASRVQYDPDVLKLQPAGMESAMWEQRLIEDDARSVWAALLQCDPPQAATLVDRLRSLDTVDEVGGAGAIVVANSDDRLQLIAETRSTTVASQPLGPGYAALAFILQSLADGVQQREASDPDMLALAATIESALEDAAKLSQTDRERSWQELDAAFKVTQSQLHSFLQVVLSDTRVGADDLPPVLRSQWVGTDGSYLLRINPIAGQASILSPERLGPFIASLREVAPDVMGPPVQILESSRLIQRSYITAALYALPVIVLLLLLDFRSLADALCALLPVGFGFIGAFGWMFVLGVPLNFANMIVLPIILGIGVDAGVHIVHRWREQPGGSPPGLSGGTGRGVTLTMLTTIIGFGCMLIAAHRGIQSLGVTMVSGLAMTLLASWTLLPAILRLRTPSATHPAGLP